MAKKMPLAEFEERFERLVAQWPPDLGDSLDACAEPILEGIRQNFQGQRTSAGEPWPPRKDPGPTHPLLHLTGALESAATGDSGMSVREVSGDELTIGVRKGASGTSLGGAAVHQFGDPPIAARPYLGFSEEVIDECVEIVADGAIDHVMEAFR